MKSVYIKFLFFPAVTLAANYVVGFFLHHYTQEPFQNTVRLILFNLVRVIVFIYIGWYGVRLHRWSTRIIIRLSVMMFAYDRIILIGGYFFIRFLGTNGQLSHEYLLALGGVLVSFVIILPIAVGLALLGSILGEKFGKKLKPISK